MDFRASRQTFAAPVRAERRSGVRLERLIPGAAMLFFLAAGLALSLANPSLFKAPEDANVLNGEWSAAYQQAFEADLGLEMPAQTVWGGFKYSVFSEGRPGVLVGSDGWLYTSEEFTAPGPSAVKENLTFITGVQARLAAEGVGLVVAVVPAKARVVPEQLGRYRMPLSVSESSRLARAQLEASGVVTLDLFPNLAAEGSAAFLRTDTHWTPRGAEVAAATIAVQVERQGLLEGFGETRFLSETGEAELLEGDLLTFLPLGHLGTALAPPPDRVTRFTTSQEGGAGSALFGPVELPVALVGTSYSSDERWHFAGALKAALGADVLNAAKPGQGPFAPMASYLDSAAFANTRPELIIWEIPERYFGVAYGLEEGL